MNNSIHWIEKYRPKKLNEIISQNEPINILNNTLITGEMPHFLLYGNSGTGKTSSIYALCNQLFGKRVNERILQLNASDERGINVVRHKIIQFANLAIGTKDKNCLCPPYKIIILDEADAMTKEAQSALRKIIEETSHITRFCFICNYINHIIEPINSRCVKIKFKPISITDTVIKLNSIAINENIKIDEEALKTISIISNGDLRKSILTLQNIKYVLSNTNNSINSNDIYNMCKYMSKEQSLIYINDILQNKNTSNLIKITNDIIKNGYIFSSIILNFIDYLVNDKNLQDNKKAILIFEMSNIEKDLNQRAGEYIQLLKILINFCCLYN
jgi:replication factor C subunit 2/4